MLLNDCWKDRARLDLLERGDRSMSWSYRVGGLSCSEPTGLAGLALIASEGDSTTTAGHATGRKAAAWLATIQREDGSLPAADGLAMPGWATPYALLLWGAWVASKPIAVALAVGCSASREGNPAFQRAKGRDRARPGSGRLALGLRDAFLARADCDGHPGPVSRGPRRPPPGQAGIGPDPRSGDPRRRLELREHGDVRACAPSPAGTHRPRTDGPGRPRRSVRRPSRPALDYLRDTAPETRAAASLGWGVLGSASLPRLPRGGRVLARGIRDQQCRRRTDADPGSGPALPGGGAKAARPAPAGLVHPGPVRQGRRKPAGR